MSAIRVIVFLAVILTALVPISVQVTIDGCQEADDESLQARLPKPSFFFAGDKEFYLPRSNVTTHQVHVVNGTSDAETLPERSLCPWTYMITFSDDLFPKEFVEVECCPKGAVCSCQTPDTTQRRPYGCQTIYIVVTFLERYSCAGGLYLYKPIPLRVGVGCACSLPRV